MTATHQPLFFAAPDPHALFEKVAAVAKMTDDEKKWPAQIISELMRQLPYLSKYSVDLDLSRIEPEAGYGLGYAMVVNKSLKNSPTDQISQPKNRIRIPVVIKERMLQPFHVFEVGGTVYPLTEDRINAAMFNPDTFDGVADKVPVSPSLIDQLYPPYQQRQGFGRVGGDGDLPAMGKSGSAGPLDKYFGGEDLNTHYSKAEIREMIDALKKHHAGQVELGKGTGPRAWLARHAASAVEGDIKDFEKHLKNPAHKVGSAPNALEEYFASAGRMKKEAEGQKEAFHYSMTMHHPQMNHPEALKHVNGLMDRHAKALYGKELSALDEEEWGHVYSTSASHPSTGKKLESLEKTASLRDFAIERGFLGEVGKEAGAKRLTRLLQAGNKARAGGFDREKAKSIAPVIQSAMGKLSRRAENFPGGAATYLEHGVGPEWAKSNLAEASHLMGREGNPSLTEMLSARKKSGMPPDSFFMRGAK